MNIPEGFVLVPKSMHLDKEIIHAINFHCGDGESGNYGAFADGSLWIGVITDDDGKEVHGLHIATAEYPEEGSTTLVEFPAAIAQPAAHLTIPGALEWGGDNGTHGVVGTHGADGESRADGESAQPVAYIDLHSKTMFPSNESVEKYLLPGRVATPLYAHADPAEVSRLRALLECSQGDMRQADQIMARQGVELDNLEQSRRSFFDLSQDLEKRLAERDALLAKCKDWIEAARDGVLYPIANEFQGVVGHNAEGLGQQSVALLEALSSIEKPAKQKTCIECDQPYCHGVCVERGDQDYDRDQAAKGGEQ